MNVRSLQEAHAAAERIGYPVVLKPAAHAASLGVIRADTPDQLPTAYEVAHRAVGSGVESTSVLVEEYLDGPEVSVECVTYRGETTVVAVTRKTVSAPPFFEELALSVDAADPLLDTVAPAARAAIDALGITNGVSHVEMRLVGGRPRLIEVNGGIAGDMIGHLVHLATGIDLPKAAADIACGRAPDLTPTRRRAAGIRMLYPADSGTLTKRHINQQFAAHTPWLRQMQWLREIGDPLLLPPDGDLFAARAGFYIVTGRDTGKVNERLDTAAGEITVTTRAGR